MAVIICLDKQIQFSPHGQDNTNRDIGEQMKTKKNRLKLLKNNRILLVMLLPAVLYVFIFNYLPMPGVLLAFKQFSYSKGIFNSPWNGFENFRFFFISGDAARVTFNTFAYNIAFLFLEIVVAVAIAVLLNELRLKRFNKTLQTTMFLPYFVSWVVVASIAYSLFNYENGTINSLVETLGGDKINIYGTPGYWPFILTAFRLWKTVGYQTVIYLAAITSIDREITEAAKVDGANILQRIFRITLPQLLPTIVILALLSIGNIFRGDFGLFYQLVGNNGLLFEATDIIDTYVFRSLLQTTNVGMAAAAGLYQSVMCFVFVMVTNGCVKKIQPDYALF